MDLNKTEEILSIGIDIGTTTTSMVISKLKIKNVAGAFLVPKIEIIEKNVIYKSEIYFTPLLNENTLDFDKIAAIIKKEYDLSRINPNDIKTGAVIITGDAARKENAENILKAISNMAGSFVVATAGPHLEAFLAGLGSGAANISKKTQSRICNVDIGGGTTNAAVFDSGKLVSTFCADIGGRLIRFIPGSDVVDVYMPAGKTVSEECGITLKKGIRLNKNEIIEIADRLVDSLISILNGHPDDLSKKLAIGKLPEKGLNLDAVMFSGGVGRLFYENKRLTGLKGVMRYNDLGPVLAERLETKKESIGAEILEPSETIYATVIGAGIHSTELSGSTIYISDPEVLPLKDLPALNIENPYGNKEKVRDEIVKKLETYRIAEGYLIPALVIPERNKVNFDKLRNLAEAIVEASDLAKLSYPFVIVCEDDIGKALGVIIKNLVGNEKPVISIDQLTIKEGDYIDIGKPLYDGGVVPVVLKTLVFSN
jgi:ethanolamine utilization protein EutA